VPFRKWLYGNRSDPLRRASPEGKQIDEETLSSVMQAVKGWNLFGKRRFAWVQ